MIFLKFRPKLILVCTHEHITNNYRRTDSKENSGWKWPRYSGSFYLPIFHIKTIGSNCISKFESNVLSKKRERKRKKAFWVNHLFRISFHINLSILGLSIQYQQQKLCLINGSVWYFKLKIGVLKHTWYNKFLLQFMVTHHSKLEEQPRG